MIQILGRLSGTNDNLLEHNPFILRTRKKSWATDQMFHAKVSGGEGGGKLYVFTLLLLTFDIYYFLCLLWT